jgi:hypothetical protein
MINNGVLAEITCLIGSQNLKLRFIEILWKGNSGFK